MCCSSHRIDVNEYNLYSPPPFLLTDYDKQHGETSMFATPSRQRGCDTTGNCRNDDIKGEIWKKCTAATGFFLGLHPCEACGSGKATITSVDNDDQKRFLLSNRRSRRYSVQAPWDKMCVTPSINHNPDKDGWVSSRLANAKASCICVTRSTGVHEANDKEYAEEGCTMHIGRNGSGVDGALALT